MKASIDVSKWFNERARSDILLVFSTQKVVEGGRLGNDVDLQHGAASTGTDDIEPASKRLRTGEEQRRAGP